MTKLKNMFGLFVLVCALCFIPNVYAEDVQQVSDWTTLKTCLENNETPTCQLSSDIAVDPKGVNIYMHDVTIDKKLDLQGFTLNASHILFVQNAKLTITGTNTGKIVGSSQGIAVDLYGSAEVLIDNVTVDGGEGTAVNLINASNNFTLGENATVNGKYGVTVVQGSTGSKATIQGTINATMGMTVHGGNTSIENAPVVNIESTAKITGSDVSIGIYAAGYGIWNINGATIKGGSAISIRSGEFEIKDATLEATGTYDDSTIPSGGTQPTGSAIDIVASDSSSYSGQIKIHISGETTVSSENGYAIHEFGLGEGKTTEESKGKVLKSIEIEDGNYAGKEGSISVEDSNSLGEVAEHFISGGTFTKDGANDTSLEKTFLDEHLEQSSNGEIVPEKVSVKVYDGTDKSQEKETKEMPYGANLLEQLKDVEWINKSDLTFAGWYYDDAFTQKVQEGDTVSDTKTTLYAKYVVTVHYNDSSEGTDFTKEIGDVIGALVDGPAKAKKRFAGWYSDSQFENVVTAQMQLAKNITLYAKYVDTVTVTFAGVTKDPITLDKGQSLGTLADATAEEGYRFVGWFLDENGDKPFVPTEPINEDTTIYAIFIKRIKITVVDENGDELELILDEGQTIKDASNYEEYLEFVNRDGKVLDGVYFEKDGETTYDKANELQYEEDTTVYPCYVFSIKVNGEEYFVIEGEMLGTLGDLSQFTKPGKTIIGFKDSEGNFYEFDYVPTSALNLTVVYEDITDVPNTLDNVQTYMMLLAAGMISILVGLGFVASKKLN